MKSFFVNITLLVFTVSATAQVKPERIDTDANARIRLEAERSSSIMRTVHFLTDVYGPRLTGTPNLKAAQEWALKELTSMGLKNAQLEAWDFGSPGWQSERLEVHAVAPFKESLQCEAMAWTLGTNGPIHAEVFHLKSPESSSVAELDEYLNSVGRQVKGKAVFTGKHNAVPVNFDVPRFRLTDAGAKAIYTPRQPSIPRLTASPSEKQILSAAETNDRIDAFLKRNGAVLRVYDSRAEHGVVRAVVNRSRDAEEYVPTIVMRNEDYGRVTRIVANGVAVKIEFNIVNRLYPDGVTAYNATAEIVGSNRATEVVMLGAHIDSHHLATGGVDNAVGVAIMIEAMRILKALKIEPLRTIRIGLWSGEEQRVLGSQEYVERHFGSAEEPKPNFNILSAYLNIDTGSGRIRGMRAFGPPAAGDVLKQILAPFADLGVAGASTYSNRTAPGSDHAAFSVNGLPGVYIDQDPLDYGRYAWHTNLDTYERVYEPDARQAAIVIASTVLHLAMRDDLLPRFTSAQMPRRQYFPASSEATKPN